MDIAAAYQRYFAITRDARAAAMLVLAEQMAGAGGQQPTTKPLSVADVAKVLRVSPEKVRAWCKAGTLRATNLGSPKRPRFVVGADEVSEFMTRRQPHQLLTANGHQAKPRSTRF